MKKYVLAALALFFIVGGVIGFALGRNMAEPVSAAEALEQTAGEEEAPAESPANPEEEPAESPAPTAEPTPAPQVDYEAMYALHEPDTVVMTIGGQEVTWSEYFFFLYRQAQSVENYFGTMAMYGMPLSWSDVAEGEDVTYAELTNESAVNIALSLTATAGFAAECGAELTDADRAEIEEKVLSDITALCGEDGTREDLDEYLESIYLPPALYDTMNEVSALYQSGFTTLYGENGEKLSDGDALAWLEENGYLRANHILLMTIDPATRESLDEEAKAEKLAKAQEIAAELQAIDAPEELLSRFAELKEEFDEDTGKTAYPDGYVFLPGEMVVEFEETVKSQEAYQVSDPVESAYGYHVILTLPLDPDAVIEFSSAGTPMTARSLAANETYSQAADAFAEAQEIVFAEGFEEPDLLDYLK